MIYIPSDPFSDPFIPFGSINYLELNNIFSSSNNSHESVDSLDSHSPNQNTEGKVNDTLSNSEVSGAKSQDLRFETWDNLGKIIQS